ncbi:MAG TPA: lytic transglycosylase domain-containing protein [Xanthobacteraceae bacterium]|nr:lytic transglycosylase domain-containing protein [Xanthobacteraceae bacterium]
MRWHNARMQRGRLAAMLCLLAIGMAGPEPVRAEPGTETVEETICRLVEASAAAQGLPVDIFTRLIWRESSFRGDAVSPKGAQGIAQFMPGTAAERGLADPFDPETALPAAATLLAELWRRLGNLGLAAAAYNAGPTRVRKWLAGDGGLPLETRDYLVFVTGRTAEDWARQGAGELPPQPEAQPPAAVHRATNCRETTLALRRGGGPVAQEIASVTAPWGVQLSGSFSKARALAAYGRTQARYAAVLDGTQPMIIGGRLRWRGSGAYYRVRVAQPTRVAALALCQRLRKAGAACIVLPS